MYLNYIRKTSRDYATLCIVTLRQDFLYSSISNRRNSLPRDVLEDESRKVTLKLKEKRKKGSQKN